MYSNKISFLEVMGSPFEIGLQIGSKFKDRIKKIFQEYSKFRKHRQKLPENRIHILKMLEFSKNTCPSVISEIKGMSEGSGIPFFDLFLHNCMHMPYWSNCSTSFLMENKAIYIAHNEDAHPILEKYAYFVFIRSNESNSIPFFSHCYPGIVPGMSYGFNIAGIVQTCNSLPDPTKTVGIPRMFVGRKIYEKVSTISDAINLIETMKPRSGGANYNLASMRENQIISIETTGLDYAVIPIQDRFFRANHYISEKFKHYPAASAHTITRQNRGNELIPNIKEFSELLDIMRDKSIFLTMENTNNECQTNSTLLFKITDTNIQLKKYENDTQTYSYVELVDFI